MFIFFILFLLIDFFYGMEKKEGLFRNIGCLSEKFGIWGFSCQEEVYGEYISNIGQEQDRNLFINIISFFFKERREDKEKFNKVCGDYNIYTSEENKKIYFDDYARAVDEIYFFVNEKVEVVGVSYVNFNYADKNFFIDRFYIGNKNRGGGLGTVFLQSIMSYVFDKYPEIDNARLIPLDEQSKNFYLKNSFVESKNREMILFKKDFVVKK
jgi:hypothetical protein